MPENDVVVIGAGPAGAECAMALAEEGVRTTLVDDNPAAGGQIWRKPARSDGSARRGDELRAKLAAAGGVDHMAGCEVVDVRGGREVWLLDSSGTGHVLSPRAVVIATGAVERAIAVPGWENPGVFGLGGLQSLAKGQGLLPRVPVLLAGSGPLLYLVASEFRAGGVQVAAVVDGAPFPGAGPILSLVRAPSLACRAASFELRLRRAGVPIFRSHRVVEISARGEGLEVLIESSGGGTASKLAAGIVGLGGGLRPNIELAQVAGAEIGFDPALGGWHAACDRAGRTSVRHLYAIGEARGVRGVEAAGCDAVIAALAVVQDIGRRASAKLQDSVGRAQRRRVRYERVARALGTWSAMPAISADKRTIVCRCEDVARCDIDAAAALDLSDPAAVKLATRAGMGLCQGRVCAGLIDEIANGTHPPPRARFPLRPCRADAFGPELAGD